MKKQTKENKDFRKLIIEMFKVDGEKLDAMASYAEHHADMECRIAKHTLSSEKTTLPEALRLLSMLNLDGKKFETTVTVPMMRFELNVDFDYQEMPNAEMVMQDMMIKHIAETINLSMENAQTLRVNRLVCDMGLVHENGKRPVIVAHSQYKITEWS